MAVFDFKEMNQYSQVQDYDLKVNNGYKQLFHRVKSIDFVTDLQTQKSGKDKIITFSDNSQISIDEKKRGRFYNDYLVEEYSCEELKTKGWIYNITCDYISYIFTPNNLIKLVPVKPLREYYELHKEQILQTRPIIAHTNLYNGKSYTTVSYAVNSDDLDKFIKDKGYELIKVVNIQ